jgi:hydrogenase 3 maturation protease
VRVVDCGETPENFLGVIARMKPEKVIVIDAADFGGEAGEVRAVARQEVGGGGVSTHAPRLTLFTDFVEAQAGAETYFLAIQPGNLRLGEPMGAAVDRAARELADLINEVNHEIDRAGDVWDDRGR